MEIKICKISTFTRKNDSIEVCKVEFSPYRDTKGVVHMPVEKWFEKSFIDEIELKIGDIVKF